MAASLSLNRLSDHFKTITPVLGIDLSGPANHSDTCMAWRDQTGLIHYRCGCSDADILQWVEQQGESVMVMIDALDHYTFILSRWWRLSTLRC
jgi:hypothetical protein